MERGRKTVYLVSCVSAKLEHPTPARDLYRSSWFKKASHLAESQGDRWYILSAEHGLVHPDCTLAPYEKTLNNMPIAQRREWAAGVLQALGEIVYEGDTVVVFGGRRYREFLTTPLEERGVNVEVPMAGLGIGYQLAWLSGKCVETAPHTEQ